MFTPLLLLACATPDPSHPAAQPADLDLATDRAPVVWSALSHLDEGRYTLPEDLGGDTVESIRLDRGWKRLREVDDMVLWTQAVPFQLPRRRYREAPAGMVLKVEGRSVPYMENYDRMPAGTRSWMVDGDRIVLASKQDPGSLTPPPELVHPGSVSLAERLSPSRAGLPAPQFVSLEVTRDDDTRPCVYLPAPATASWDVDVPARPRLEFAVALRDPPQRDGPRGDGVRFQVRVNDTVAWQQKVTHGRPFLDVDLDLARWESQRVTLTLATEPLGSPEADYAVFAAPTLYPQGGDRTRRVVVVGIDTLRPDHLGFHGYDLPTSPELDQVGQQSVVFGNVHAPAPRTKPSFKTAFTGLHPLPAMNGTPFGEVFQAEGFATGGLAANVHLVPRFGFNAGFQMWHYENGAKGGDQVDRALAWLRARPERDAFLFIHIMDPHIFYDAPFPYKNRFVTHKPDSKLGAQYNRWQIYSRMDKGTLTLHDQSWIRARYDGEVAFTSHQMERLVQGLDSLPGRTLTVFHSDHGEEFWEHGGFEHNHTLYEEVLRVLLWFRPPSGLQTAAPRVTAPVSLLDLAPTLYDLVGIPRDRWPKVEGLSLRDLLSGSPEQAQALQEALTRRPLHAGYLMYDKERWAVLIDGHKYILQTASGDEELYDLGADPRETRNLARDRAADLPRFRQALSEATGWPVGMGWRIQFPSLKDTTVTVTFPVPVRDAGVMDPEAAVERRANLEWGEKPSRRPEEVATAVLSPDRTTLTITGGVKPRGTVWVVFGDPEPTSAILTSGDRVQEVGPDPGGVFSGKGQLTITRGAVIGPLDSVAEELHAKGADDASMEALRSLGYVE